MKKTDWKANPITSKLPQSLKTFFVIYQLRCKAKINYWIRVHYIIFPSLRTGREQIYEFIKDNKENVGTWIMHDSTLGLWNDNFGIQHNFNILPLT